MLGNQSADAGVEKLFLVLSLERPNQKLLAQSGHVESQVALVTETCDKEEAEKAAANSDGKTNFYRQSYCSGRDAQDFKKVHSSLHQRLPHLRSLRVDIKFGNVITLAVPCFNTPVFC